jgi:phosphoenolpyruvate synthase/pyruvate phosphate dikinase
MHVRFWSLEEVVTKLRDDDNIYLGALEQTLIQAKNYAIDLLIKRKQFENSKQRENYVEKIDIDEIILSLEDEQYIISFNEKDVKTTGILTDKISNKEPSVIKELKNIRFRQITGQPASKGFANGKAKVIRTKNDLLEIKEGDIIVCDAIDPTMTFIIPLCAGIIERRGGMLIHGAIIAREYGIPCVTGVPDAISIIKTGNNISIDGYLGIVTVMNS